MKLQVVESGLVFKNWTSVIWKGCFFTISLLACWVIFFEPDYFNTNDYQLPIGSSILLISLLLSLVNSVVYKKCGELILEGNTLHLSGVKEEFNIYLEAVRKVSYETTQNNLYKFRFDEYKVELNLTADELTQLKDHLSEYSIEVVKISLFNRLKNFLKMKEYSSKY